jgi:hypothetical protein
MAKKRRGGKGKPGAPAASAPRPGAAAPAAPQAVEAAAGPPAGEGPRPLWGVERFLPARAQGYLARVGARQVRRTTIFLVCYGLFMMSVAYWPARSVRGEVLRVSDLDREMWIRVLDGPSPGPEWKIAIYPDTQVSLKDSPELFTWLDMKPGDTLELTYWPTLYGRRLSKAIVVTRRAAASPAPTPTPTGR